MPGKPISKTAADAMIKDYIGYMTGLGVDMNKQTQYVSFTPATLLGWLNQKLPDADELRVFMGLYPPGHPQAGKTTVIFWPYKEGQPVSEGIGAKSADGPLAPDPDVAFNDGNSGP